MYSTIDTSYLNTHNCFHQDPYIIPREIIEKDKKKKNTASDNVEESVK